MLHLVALHGRTERSHLVLLFLLALSVVCNWYFFVSFRQSNNALQQTQLGFSLPSELSSPSFLSSTTFTSSVRSGIPLQRGPQDSSLQPKPARSSTIETKREEAENQAEQSPSVSLSNMPGGDAGSRPQGKIEHCYHDVSTRTMKCYYVDAKKDPSFHYAHLPSKSKGAQGQGVLSAADNDGFEEDPTAFHTAERNDLYKMMAFTEFEHRRFLWHNAQLYCQQRLNYDDTELLAKVEGKVGWVTATINDAYVIPAIALAHSIHKFSCLTDNLLAIISSEVSKEAREVLTKSGWKLLERPPLDCQHEAAQPDSLLAQFPGEHMRFHVWNLTEYDRLVYVDCDIMLLDNLDELFRLPLQPHQIYAARFSPPADEDKGSEMKTFVNSGLLVLRPSSQITSELLADWRSMFRTKGCVADQPFLRRFFDQPERGLRYLPYAYNVRRNAYHPMRLFHMASSTKFEKLWLSHNKADRKTARDKPIENIPKDAASVWWFMFYDALDVHGLNEWWAKVEKNNGVFQRF